MTPLVAPKKRAAAQPRPWAGLRAVAPPERRLSRLPFVLVLALFLGLGMVGLLLLTTTLQNQAFVVRDQQRAAAELGYRMADLEAQVTQARSSTQLAVRASALGLKPNPYPVFLVMPEGRLMGVPTAVTGGELPEVRYRTPEQLQAEEEARAAAEKARKKLQAERRRLEAEARAQAEAEAAKRRAED